MRNSIEFEGTITRDPDSGYGNNSGAPYWRANLACNGTRYDSQNRQQVVTTTFGQTVAFGYKAEELMEEGFTKGDQILIRGQLGNNTYEDADGKKVTKTQIEILGYDVIRKNRQARSAPVGASTNANWDTPAPATQGDPWGTPTGQNPFG